MTIEDLARIIERPATHRRIVGDYAGAYSLGVTRHPSKSGGAFLLRVEDHGVENMPRSVTIEGEEIPVIVQGGCRAPRPL